ncbi:DUF4185 domain-containing protein [Hoyosella altamirensis]|uniref:DUF4185 domain-containing protein n=1 Tax=Hoyosella altamirensis TaxID=616997 RepID=A0A839RSZ1_9ACTN|nr:DUF4185 domain-containing protein [Hoyosella altamirensis]MBB3038961.1 hypothetical protein [Hoyosella altamirensis]
MSLGRNAASVTTTVAVTLGGVLVASGFAGAQPCADGAGAPGGGSGGFGGISHSGADQQGPLPEMPEENPTQSVSWMTGANSPNDTFSRFGITGTDLGIMWDNGGSGDDQQLLVAFGDTVGDCRQPGGEWRSNALLRSVDTDLSDGVDLLVPRHTDSLVAASVAPEGQDFARQIIEGLGFSGVEVTIIPTAAVAIDGKQYINYMSVREWGDHGEWRTNFSAIAVSEDNGHTWETALSTIRLSSDVSFEGVPQFAPGHENFQMHAYVKSGEYLYGFGTPPGRFGAAHLSRVAVGDILDLNAYEYWNGVSWEAEAAQTEPVIPAPVSELSVQWNEYLGKFIAMYADEPAGTIVLRTAESPEGPWSDASILIDSSDISGLYAPYIHPWSSGNTLYFAISRWSDYNVLLMRTDLDELGERAALIADDGMDILTHVSLH